MLFFAVVPTGTAQRVQLLQCRQRKLVCNRPSGSHQSSAAGNLDLIDTENIKVVDGAPSHPIGVAHFIKTPLAGEVGFTLKINPEKLEEVQKAIPTFSPLDFNVLLTSKNNRVASLPLTTTACTPLTTVEDDALTVSVAELSNPDFERNSTSM